MSSYETQQYGLAQTKWEEGAGACAHAWLVKGCSCEHHYSVHRSNSALQTGRCWWRCCGHVTCWWCGSRDTDQVAKSAMRGTSWERLASAEPSPDQLKFIASATVPVNIHFIALIVSCRERYAVSLCQINDDTQTDNMRSVNFNQYGAKNVQIQ
jgi:hypothetical protein